MAEYTEFTGTTTTTTQLDTEVVAHVSLFTFDNLIPEKNMAPQKGQTFPDGVK
jgi:hypothetical protein